MSGSWRLTLTGFSAIFTGVNLVTTDLLSAGPGPDDVPDADLHLEHGDHGILF